MTRSVSMIFRSLLTLAALLSLAAPAPALAGFDIGDLMKELATFKGGHAKYVEKKYIALLDRPVISTGEMYYVAPGYLEKKAITPKPERMILDGGTISLMRGEQKLSIHLANQPEAQAFVDSIRGTMAGDRSTLERNYRLLLGGERDRWQLTLLPSEQKIASLVQRITISGRRGEVRQIEYLQTDGDRTVLDIEPFPQGK